MKLWVNILIMVTGIIIVLGVGIKVLIDLKNSPDLTYIICCNGNICTDTYYSEKDNMCHLVLCENSFLGHNCTYPALNSTIAAEYMINKLITVK